VLRCLLVGEALTYSDMAAIYLCKVYWLCWSTVALLLLLLVQAASSYSFVLPHLLPLRFEHQDGWSGPNPSPYPNPSPNPNPNPKP